MKTIKDSLCPRGVEVLVRKPYVADNDNGKDPWHTTQRQSRTKWDMHPPWCDRKMKGDLLIEKTSAHGQQSFVLKDGPVRAGWVAATLVSTLDTCDTTLRHDHQNYVCDIAKLSPWGAKSPLGRGARYRVSPLDCGLTFSHQDAWARTPAPRIPCPIRPHGAEVKRPWSGAVRTQGWTEGRSRTDLGQLWTWPPISYESLRF